MMGVNVTYKDPIGRLSVASLIREFHVWSWNEPKQDQTDWNPQQHIDFNQYYANLDALGHDVDPVIQETPTWMFKQGMNEQSQPLDNFILKGTAAGFRKQSVFIKSFADYFSPFGIHYVENWNEPDKDWFGTMANFAPGDLAALCSADYDAIQNITYNGTIAPVKLVMGGLAYPNIDYLQGMFQWCQVNRKDGNIPFNVLNLHHYSNSAPDHSSPKNGISPEDDHLRERMSDFVLFRDQFMPDKELWVSEFGYDTWPTSTQGVPNIKGQTPEETQGQWIVRSFLAMAAAGVDRSVLFALSDSGDPNIRYNTSGLLTNINGSIVPKVSWYYVSALRNIMKDMRFNKEVDSSDPEVKIYKFTDSHNQKDVYAIWCPTSKGKKTNYSFAGKGQSIVNVVYLAEGSTAGIVKPSEVVNNSITLMVSELPLFVLSGKADTTTNQLKRIPLTPDMLNGPIEARGIMDEQNQGEPIDGKFKEIETARGWTNNTAQPIEAIIDFKKSVPLKGINLKDTFNEGFVNIFYMDASGVWKQIIHDPMRRYFVWDPYFFKTSIITDKLKVVLEGQAGGKTSHLGEIMVYTEE